MASMSDRYDTALLGILQNEGQIDKFMDKIFGFLYRKTDYYRIMKEKDEKMGFPPGIAAKIAYSQFKKYEALALKDEEERQAHQSLHTQKLLETVHIPEPTDTIPPPAVETVEVETETPQAMEVQADSTEKSETDKADPAPLSKPTNTSSTSSKGDTKTDGNEGDEDPELTRMQQLYQSNPESYNGAMRDNYSWSQQITDVDVMVKVPVYVKKGKEVKVDIQKKRLKVQYRDQTGAWLPVVDEALSWDINKEESMWSLVPGEHVHINLEKVQERWWENLLENEAKINVRKIDASRPMSDLDPEAQAKIEEMMYNDRQKKLGLPQTHEQKVHATLKKAWDAEGSPFKGQTFDPSKFDITPNNVMS